MKKLYHLKRKVALILSLLMVFTLITGCSSSEKKEGDDNSQASNVEPEYQERIVIANSTVLTRTDPQATNTEVNMHVHSMTHNTLFDYDVENDKIYGDLVKEWENINDSTFLFKLHKGVKFHNDVEFTAKDVVFTFEKAKGVSYREPLVKLIKEIEIIDDYTIKLELTEPHQEFLVALTESTMSMLCEQASLEEGERPPGEDPIYPQIGTGPYILDEWIPRDYVLLKRNENYFGELPKTKEIVYRQIDEASAAVVALQTGEIDILIDPSEIAIDNIAGDSNLDLIMGQGTNFIYIAASLNGAGGRTLLKDNTELRKAIALAINQDDIVKVVYGGKAVPAKSFLPPGVYGYFDDVKSYAYEYNPEKAREILKAQGYGDGLDIEITYNLTRLQKMFEMLQSQMREVGINLKAYKLESADYTKAMREGDYDLIVAMQSFNVAAVGCELNNLWATGSGSNKMRAVERSYIDEMLEKAIIEIDPIKRLQMYKELQEYMVDFSAIIPLVIPIKYVATRAGIDGIEFRADNRIVFSYAHKAE